jgi:hypothetical protein
MTKRAGNVAFLLALVGTLSWTNPGSAQPPSPSSGKATLSATVRSVDAQARTLELVTGVGYALHVVKLTLGDRAEVRTPAGLAPLVQLKPGDRVRVEYTKGVDGNTATAIEILPAPEAGSAP